MNLKYLRKEKTLTQKDLAKMLNIAVSTYSGYELETSEPSLNTLIKLANYYDVSLDYLVGREYNNNIGYLNEEQKNTIKLINKLKDLLLLDYQTAKKDK